MIIKRVKKLIKNPQLLILYAAEKGLFNWMPDKTYIKMIYKLRTGRKIDLENPTSFNEKLQWLKLHDRKGEYIQYVDKYEVRKHIAVSIGEEYLIPLIDVYDKPEEIDFDLLPDQFVLKCTHDSGGLIICNDKSQLDQKTVIKKLNKCLKRNYYFHGREWPYKDLKPRIICEKFISDNDKHPPVDYKLLCFNGKAKLIEVHIDRFGKHKQDFYNIDWEKTKISQNMSTSDILLSRPVVLKDMIELSEILAQNTYHVRIDWYLVKNKLFFGEVTFFDGSGFCPFDSDEDDVMLGNLIDLTMNNYLNEG